MFCNLSTTNTKFEDDNISEYYHKGYRFRQLILLNSRCLIFTNTDVTYSEPKSNFIIYKYVVCAQTCVT